MAFAILITSMLIVEMVLFCVIPLLADGVAQYIGGIRNYMYVLAGLCALLIFLLFSYRQRKLNKENRVMGNALMSVIWGLGFFVSILLILALDKGSSTYALVILFIPRYFALSLVIPFGVWGSIYLFKLLFKLVERIRST